MARRKKPKMKCGKVKVRGKTFTVCKVPHRRRKRRK